MCVVVSDSVTLYYGPPGSSVHGIFSGKNTGVGSHFLLQGNLPTYTLLCASNFGKSNLSFSITFYLEEEMAIHSSILA